MMDAEDEELAQQARTIWLARRAQREAAPVTQAEINAHRDGFEAGLAAGERRARRTAGPS